MKDYSIDYTYETIQGEIVSDRYCCQTEEESNKKIEELKATRKLTILTLITYEYLI